MKQKLSVRVFVILHFKFNTNKGNDDYIPKILY